MSCSRSHGPRSPCKSLVYKTCGVSNDPPQILPNNKVLVPDSNAIISPSTILVYSPDLQLSLITQLDRVQLVTANLKSYEWIEVRNNEPLWQSLYYNDFGQIPKIYHNGTFFNSYVSLLSSRQLLEDAYGFDDAYARLLFTYYSQYRRTGQHYALMNIIENFPTHLSGNEIQELLVFLSDIFRESMI